VSSGTCAASAAIMSKMTASTSSGVGLMFSLRFEPDSPVRQKATV
jgi:hypothetical protein